MANLNCRADITCFGFIENNIRIKVAVIFHVVLQRGNDMRHVRILFRYLIFIMYVMLLIVVIDTGLMTPSAYAQTCNTEQSTCLAKGGSWNGSVCTMPQNNTGGGNGGSSGTYSPDPCSIITRWDIVSSYPTSCLLPSCSGCAYVELCCYHQIIYNTYGLNGQFCGTVGGSTAFSCGIISTMIPAVPSELAIACINQCTTVNIIYPGCYAYTY